MSSFKKLRNKYVIWHANRVGIPKFTQVKIKFDEEFQ